MEPEPQESWELDEEESVFVLALLADQSPPPVALVELFREVREVCDGS